MSLSQQEARRIIFVSRYLSGESMRIARAVKKLDGIVLFGVCERLPDDDGAAVFSDLVRLADVHDTDQLTGAARGLAGKHGVVNRIVTTTETLLEPVACVSEMLGLPGMSVATVRRALEKPRLRSALEEAGIIMPRDQVLTSGEAAKPFLSEVGFPIVLKPVGGSGALATLCVRNSDQLELALELMQPTPERAVLAQEFLRGQELCIDTITVANEPQFYSICCYRPSILEALENPGSQWTCVMPRDITGHQYRDFIEQGLKAVRALSVGNAMTHMEGFLMEGGGLCFTDATLRPAGARIAPMLAFAYDMDPYLAWARVAVDGCFDGPWERKYAVGTIFLRGMGTGLVENIHGVDSVSQQVGALLMESRLPRVGGVKSATYTGDGYITVRHPDTHVVEDVLQLIGQTVRIGYSQSELPVASNAAISTRWSQRMQDFDKQLNKPAWDDDSLLSLSV